MLKKLKDDGWYLDRQGATSHRKFKHPEKPGLVVLAGEPSDDIPIGTLKKIYKDAGW